MSTRLHKPWRSISDVPHVLKGHLGVFQLANAAQEVIYIGFAGGNSRLGLRGEVQSVLTELSDAVYFRHEITSSYMTRYRELMMVHVHDYGVLPVANPPIKLGKLSPG
ncbi:MAG: hypothetical protein AAF993_01570 [Pseudomonadota bacterium]